MKTLNIVVEGSTEESFVKDVLVKHFQSNVFVYCRKIKTGWDKTNNKPAKGGLLKYRQFRNDITRWMEEDRGRENTFYSSFIDLYAFPKDNESPYSKQIQDISNPYDKVKTLEKAIETNISNPAFIPYVQLHEFEAFLLVSPDKLVFMYPNKITYIERLKKEIVKLNPEEINETPQNAPSKRIIKHIPEYEAQKAQVGPLVAGDIGIDKLRNHCPHFNDWINRLETILLD
ncbi:hypothetical protein EZS27_010350 [termite gut metagenome]|uniref:DUF4276 family protein n=1 Tax=termite gut metagenome TaxID=433724 RepID=A0A5J4S7Q5_9ZZZZ